MAEFKLNIGDSKTGKTVKKVVSGDQADVFLKKKIGDNVKGDPAGFAGYEFLITGGSDYCGFPMRKDVEGTARKKILIVSGIGIRKNRKGRRIRRTVAGNTIYSRTAQINLKIVNKGKEDLFAEKKQEKQKEEKPEAQKEGKKEEAPKEEKKPEAPEKEKTEKKKEEKPKQEAKQEDKKEEEKKEDSKEGNQEEAAEEKPKQEAEKKEKK